MSLSRRECERIGLRCVEELLERGITEGQLLKAGEILTASQYSDVVEERNIESLCGYPLCNNDLGPVPKQKYHISLAKKQIYDLTERKKFCSDLCFKCSQYFAAQLSTTHLWLRTDTKKHKLKLLEKDPSEMRIVSNCDVTVGSQAGEQHQIPPTLSELPQLECLEHLRITEKNTEPFPKPHDSPPPLGNSSSDEESLDGGSEEEIQETGPAPRENFIPEARSFVGSAATSEKLPFPEVSQVSKLLNAISTWVLVPRDSGAESQEKGVELSTEVSVPKDSWVEYQGKGEKFRLKPQNGSGVVETKEKEKSDTYGRTHTSDKRIESSCGESKSCDHLVSDQATLDSKDSDNKHKEGIVHQPERMVDSKDTEHSQTSNSGTTSKQSSSRKEKPCGKAKSKTTPSKRSNPEAVSVEEEGEPEGVVLPPVHSVNVGGIQRSLFNSQLRRHLLGVCPLLNLSFHQVLPRVVATTQNFRLNRHCITFRVPEWKILTVLLIIRSCDEVACRDALQNSQVQQWLEAIHATEQDFKLLLASFG